MILGDMVEYRETNYGNVISFTTALALSLVYLHRYSYYYLKNMKIVDMFAIAHLIAVLIAEWGGGGCR